MFWLFIEKKNDNDYIITMILIVVIVLLLFLLLRTLLQIIIKGSSCNDAIYAKFMTITIIYICVTVNHEHYYNQNYDNTSIQIHDCDDCRLEIMILSKH